MAWLQNLAGQAENLLNKIDQNTASTPSDSFKPNEELGIVEVGELSTGVNVAEQPPPSTTSSTNNSSIVPALKSAEGAQVISEFANTSDTDMAGLAVEDLDLTPQEQIAKLQRRILEADDENRDLTKQLLHVQHMYTELRDDNNKLVEHADQTGYELLLLRNEKETYVARAHRILMEKERLLRAGYVSTDTDLETTLKLENQELRKDIDVIARYNAESSVRYTKLMNECSSLKARNAELQQIHDHATDFLENRLLVEKHQHFLLQEDYVKKRKDLDELHIQLMLARDQMNQANSDNTYLKKEMERIREGRPQADDVVEKRIKKLNKTLMIKQDKLEEMTTERNALKLQLEQLKGQYEDVLDQLKKLKIPGLNPNIKDERALIPAFKRIAPRDRHVARRVKGAYSNLDAISIRTGAFLRRYPVARVFLFFYMVFLHLLVFAVLLWDVPATP